MTEKAEEIRIGMEVYCDLHSQSRKHIVTGIKGSVGWAEIDNDFFWPIADCFPCNNTVLPTLEEEKRIMHKIFGS